MPESTARSDELADLSPAIASDARNWLLAARRQMLPVLIGCGIAAVCAAVYLLKTAPVYSATAVLFVDNRKVRTVQDSYDFPAVGFDNQETTAIATAAILKSDTTLLEVIGKLDLVEDPAFAGPPRTPGLLQRLSGFALANPNKAPAIALDPELLRQGVVDRLRRDLIVRRLPRTQIMEISYTSASPEVAARIANAFADAYIADQLKAKYETTRRAGAWLEERLEDIKHGLVSSELEVERFKAKLVGSKPISKESLGDLRELEHKRASHKAIYASFLQRYQETLQQESFPIVDVRLVSGAKAPGAPSNPDPWRLFAFALFVGAVAGAGVGALRELYDGSFRTGRQVRDALGLELLGTLPLVEPIDRPAGRAPGGLAWLAGKPQPSPRYRDNPHPVEDDPRFRGSEALHTARVALHQRLGEKKPKVLGVVSIMPGEGSTTTARALGSLLALQGFETLLIDGDVRERGLSRRLALDAGADIAAGIAAGKPLADLAVRKPGAKLAVLPAAMPNGVASASDYLASPAMKTALEQAAFDYVILDLPPIGLFVDARAVAPQVDAFLLVVAWGGGDRTLAQEMLGSEELIREKCIGVVFNKTDFEKLRLYASAGSREYNAYRHSRSIA